jgi:plasmid stability protein
LRLPEEMQDRLTERAAAESRAVNAVAVDAIGQYLDGPAEAVPAQEPPAAPPPAAERALASGVADPATCKHKHAIKGFCRECRTGGH